MKKQKPKFDEKDFTYKTPSYYLRYPYYIISDDNVKNHIYQLWKTLQGSNGIRIWVQRPRIKIANMIIAGWYRLGFQEKADGKGELVTTNKRTGEKIYTMEITLELKPKLRA